MAELTKTLLDRAVVRAREKFTEFENRVSEGGVIQVFKDDAPYLLDPKFVEDQKKSLRRPVTFPVLKSKDIQVGTVRTITPVHDKAETEMVNQVWTTRTFNFEIPHAIHTDNYIGEVETMAQLIHDSLKSIYFDDADSLESFLYGYLEANKYTDLDPIRMRDVSVGTGSYELKTENYIVQAPPIMRYLKMAGPFNDVTNVTSVARMRAQAMYGSSNQYDAKQYLGDMRYYMSNNIPITEDMEETHFVIPRGNLAILNIIEDDAKKERKAHDGQYHYFRDPWFGFGWGVYVRSERVDASSDYGTGFERIVKTQWQFAADFCAMHAFSSKAGQTPILKLDTKQM